MAQTARPAIKPADQSSAAAEAKSGHVLSGPEDKSDVSFLREEPKCSYCPVCSTGSPLRKVVSHIFGRNKLSTRQIPKNVWVYYCRKHYQRSRYRNPRGFARQQVLLVRRQCERLEQWGGVKQWVIKVRRREELRMTREEEDGGAAEEAEDMADEEGGEGGGGGGGRAVATALDEDEAATNGEGGSRRSSNATVTNSPGGGGGGSRRGSVGGGSGSGWIRKYTGREKTIQDVYSLLEKIEVEVQNNGGKFPDVELLPNVDLALAVSANGNSDGNGREMPNPEETSQLDPAATHGLPQSRKRNRSVDSGTGDEGDGDGGVIKKLKAADGSGKGKGKQFEEGNEGGMTETPQTPPPPLTPPLSYRRSIFSMQGGARRAGGGYHLGCPSDAFHQLRPSHSPASAPGESNCRRSSTSWEPRMGASDAPLYSHPQRQRQQSMSDGTGMGIQQQFHPPRPQHGTDEDGFPPAPAFFDGKKKDTMVTAARARGMEGGDDEMREFGGPLVRKGREGKHSF